MTPEQHYQTAQTLLEEALASPDSDQRSSLLAIASTHAQLGVLAAFIDNNGSAV